MSKKKTYQELFEQYYCPLLSCERNIFSRIPYGAFSLHNITIRPNIISGSDLFAIKTDTIKMDYYLALRRRGKSGVINRIDSLERLGNTFFNLDLYELTLMLVIYGVASIKFDLDSCDYGYRFDYKDPRHSGMVNVCLVDETGLGDHLYQVWLHSVKDPKAKEYLRTHDLFCSREENLANVSRKEISFKEREASVPYVFPRSSVFDLENIFSVRKKGWKLFRHLQADFFYNFTHGLILPEMNYAFIYSKDSTGKEDRADELVFWNGPLSKISVFEWLKPIHGCLRTDIPLEATLREKESGIVFSFAEAELLRKKSAPWA